MNQNLTNSNNSQKKEVTLSITLKKENGEFFFDGELDGMDIAGNFKDSEGKISGNGEYGYGATSSGGEIGNPFGQTKFTITSTALAWRWCEYHGEELHAGWDFAVGGIGQPIYSVTAGEVVTAGAVGGYGNHVVIIRSGNMYILYGHMSAMTVKVGDTVKKGDRIGSQGSEGYSTGPHLHLEFRQGSISGQTTANKDKIMPMLMQWASNYQSCKSEFNGIVR